MKNYLFTGILLGISIVALNGQLTYSSPDAMDGYTLFTGSGNAYLVDNCGELINQWSSVFPKYHVKLRPNGNLVYINNVDNKILERNWAGEVVTELDIKSNTIRLNYEVIWLENGNYLCIARRTIFRDELIALGFDYDPDGQPTVVDVIVELDKESGEIVWQWNIEDHIIQERSDTLGNFGIVKDNPQLLNVDAISRYDWTQAETFMINGFDYNRELDQIILSIRKMSEVVIIDHSTTTEEAKGSEGGNSGKGGDILYRWGNPKNYGRGNTAARYLYFQHNPNWIEYGEHKGKITIYNNGLNRPVDYGNRYSSAPIIDPPLDQNSQYILDTNFQTTPALPDMEYSRDATGNNFFSGYTSASKILANGNILITVGGSATVMELEPDGTLVWEYKLQNAFTFRAEKYPASYAAFAGQDLTPKGAIEDPPSNVKCNLVSHSVNFNSDQFKVWSNMEDQTIHIEDLQNSTYQWSLFEMSGRLVTKGVDRGTITLSVAGFGQGIYLLRIVDVSSGTGSSYKIFLQ